MKNKMTNNQVIEAWLEKQPARACSLTTDGRFLYSYAFVIGRYGPDDDQPVIWNYTARGGNFKSNTTSHHVNKALTITLHLTGEDASLRPPPYV
jgi:hypothetical protein